MTFETLSARVLVFCTDKGQHPRTQLGGLVVKNGEIVANLTSTFSTTGERRKDESVFVDERGRVHLRCPRCRRHVQWRSDRALSIVEALYAVDNTDTYLDLSQVP